jgi:HEAT repeat protein
VSVPDDRATDPTGSSVTEPVHDARVAAVVAGHRHDETAARGHLGHRDPLVRCAGLSALSRMGALTEPDVLAALADPVPTVRRRAVEGVSPTPPPPPPGPPAGVRAALIERLTDPDSLVVEVTCWSMGEFEEHDAIGPLSAIATGHADLRCRESAVAALGAIGDPDGLPAVLEALHGKPTLRRRAAVALAGFEGDEADVALRSCLDDRDWQVRQVAEALLDP